MDKKKLSGIMALVVFLTSISTYMVTYDGTPYYCEGSNQICIGTRLSSTSKTCYFVENGTEKAKQCLKEPYWKIYKNEELTTKNGKKYMCYPLPRGCELVVE